MDEYTVLKTAVTECGVRYHDCEEKGATRRSVVIKEFTCRDFAEAAVHIREAIVTAEIAHPNICKVLGLLPTQEPEGIKIRIVLESIRKSLMQDIEARRGESPQRRYTEAELRTFLRQMASALQFANAKGIAHRDLNPDHIFLTEQGVFKLSDFGAAWRGDEGRLAAHTLFGQLIYMCPAMKAAKAAGSSRTECSYDVSKADVYSLGVTSLCMQRLFHPEKLSTNNKHEESANAYLNQMRADGFSPDLVSLISKMIKLNEADRFSATNVLEALSEPAANTNIASVLRSELALFRFGEEKWARTPISGVSQLNVDENTAFTFLDNQTVFCCGGGSSPFNHASFVKTNGQAKALALMVAGRRRHGLIFHTDSNFIFVFGGLGSGNVLRSAEKFAKPRGKPNEAWAGLREMQYPRCNFNPCVYAGLIYLVGGGHPSMELFDPRFDFFRSCSVLDIDPAVSITVAHLDKLSMIAPAMVYRRSSSSEELESKPGAIGAPGWSNSTPVVSENAVFAVTVTGGNFTLLKLGAISGRVLSAYPSS